MMLQAWQALSEAEKRGSAYILLSPSDDMDALDDVIEEQHRKGIFRFFIDEITAMPDFIDGANFLSDMIAGRGMHVVLAGTDSLGFSIAERNSLYDRCRMIHTTWVPFHEHARLLNTDSVDDYISSGGIFSPNRLELLKNYTLSSIAENIQNTLAHYKNGSRFGNLYSLYEENLLLTAINNVVNDDQHRFIMEVVRVGELHDLKLAKQLSRGTPEGNLLRKINLDAVLKATMTSLSHKRRELMFGKITRAHIYEINEYLRLMGVIEPAVILEWADITSDVSSKPGLQDRGQPTRYSEWLLVQPGLRWAQSEALIEALEEEFFTRDASDFMGAGAKRAEYIASIQKIFTNIRYNARGKILENVVLAHTARVQKRYNHVFCFRAPAGEIDMIVAAKDGSGFEAYEIKNSLHVKNEHSRHLMNEQFIQALEKNFGPLRERVVLFRGKDSDGPSVKYRNVSSYLHDCYNHPLHVEDPDDDNSPAP